MSAPAAAGALPPFAARLAASLPGAGALLADLLGARTAGRGSAPAGREAAVLLLLGPGADGGGDVVLLERAADLRSHPGQVAFPGGRLEAGDGGDPAAAALREAVEETGVRATGVRVLGALAPLHVPVSGHRVHPVLAWEPVASPLAPGDPGEVARVLRAPLPVLADPATRVAVRAASGWVGPAFVLDDLVVWGFTGVLLAGLLRLAGLERPWDAGRELALPARFAGRAAPPPPRAGAP